MTYPRLLLLSFALAAVGMESHSSARGDALSDDEALALGIEAYVYGYPLVTMEMTRRVMTNVVAPDGTRAPMGQFLLKRTYPDASFRDVTAPNADTLYSTAWLDLAGGPYVLSLPDLGDRYYLMPMLSGWTEVFASPGKRTTGTKAQTYVITGPGYRGPLPKGATQLKSPTNLVWILGRTYSTGTPDDYRAVHAVMDQYRLVPLSAYGKPFTPPAGKFDPAIDMQTPVRDQVNHLEAAAFFQLLAELMKRNPPAEDDAPMVEKLARLGIAAGEDFDASRLPRAIAGQIPAAAQAKIMGHFKEGGSNVNGWLFTTKTGHYGTDYLQRAMIAAIGLGANLPDDAVYPTSDVDAEGWPYTGTHRYLLRFGPGQAPPVEAFWSITMYNKDYFFVANRLNKYTVSPRDALKYNADGSLEIYVQHESPGEDREANWLPAPAEGFLLMMRLYWPNPRDPSILNGTWQPPAVKRLEK